MSDTLVLVDADTLTLVDADTLLLADATTVDPFPLTLTIRDHGHTATIREQH